MARKKAKQATTKPQLLFLDAYDSFTYNIVSLVETQLHAKVTVVKIDTDVGDFATFLKPFAGVIAGPGPGHPGNPKDVGLIAKLWELHEQDLVPVLGICLGFQSLILASGGLVEQLPEPRHGMVRRIRTIRSSIFTDVTCFEVVQYHSLHAIVGAEPFSSELDNGNWRYPSESNIGRVELIPLAWEFPQDNKGICREMERSEDLAILMAVCHTSRPFFGIQFHPESCSSSDEAGKVFSGWWNTANKWNRQHHRYKEMSKLQICAPPSPTASFNVSKLNLHRGHKLALEERMANQSPAQARLHGRLPKEFSGSKAKQDSMKHVLDLIDGFPSRRPAPSNSSPGISRVLWRPIPLTNLNMTKLDVPTICETLGLHHGEVIVLDSECNQRADTGEHSIIGLINPGSLRLEYSVELDHVRCIKDGKTTLVSLEPYEHKIFSFLKYFMRKREAVHGDPAVPFWGGLMGYITYEACLETLGLENQLGNLSGIDLNFVFIQRSIVIHHTKRVIFVQSLLQEDQEWVSLTASKLRNVESPVQGDIPAHEFKTKFHMPEKSFVHDEVPDEKKYKSRIQKCRDFLSRGESYELCLTDQARVYTPRNISPWSLYLQLRKQNAAPFSAFVQFGPIAHLSSSPERFLSWTRRGRRDMLTIREGENGGMIPMTSTVEFRPIKGTVKRFPGGPGSPPISLEQATAILETPKEQAENLMIVDLIRHDLHRIVGSGNVRIPKLMVVEEYSTLFQLVSVIQGSLHTEAKDGSHCLPETPSGGSTSRSEQRYSELIQKGDPGECSYNTGIDVLAASLPPGSMTGAPKRRSCEILEQLTLHNRGLYSGVLGYMDVGGGGDFSVVIRGATRWTRPRRMGPGSSPLADDPWIIGAGGAVTALSTEEGEWEEMLGKLAATMGVFAPDKDIGGQA